MASAYWSQGDPIMGAPSMLAARALGGAGGRSIVIPQDMHRIYRTRTTASVLGARKYYITVTEVFERNEQSSS